MSCLFGVCLWDLFKGKRGLQSSWYLSVFKLLPIECNAQKKEVLAISTK